MRRGPLALLLASALGACSAEDPAPPAPGQDASVGTDGGVAGPDAGARADAGPGGPPFAARVSGVAGAHEGASAGHHLRGHVGPGTSGTGRSSGHVLRGGILEGE